MTFGEKVYYLRKNMGLTQKELARKIGVTPNKVSNWELGKSKPTSKQLFALAGVLNVSTQYLTINNSDTLTRTKYYRKGKSSALFFIVLFIIVLLVALFTIYKLYF